MSGAASGIRNVRLGRSVRSVLVTLLVLPWPGGRAVGQTEAGAAPPSRSPIVLIVADDLGYGDLACYGNARIATPSIDRIAARGLRFTQAYVTSSVCSPSRAGLLTGRYQQRWGYYNNADAKFGLPLRETTLADVLRDADYATAAVGKWHLGTDRAHHPLSRGFDEFWGFLSGSRSYRLGPAAGANQPILSGFEPVDESGYLTDRITDVAIDFIERKAGEPYFLYVSYSAVHTPMEPREAIAGADGLSDEELGRERHFALLRALDEGVGRILDALDEVEVAPLVVFLSDNGAAPENFASNAPLRGRKNELFEGGVRVPMIVSWPGRIAPGTTTAETVMAFDLFPTFADVAGATLPGTLELDGVDLAPVLAGGALPERTLFWEDNRYWAVRKGDWKLVCTIREWRYELFDVVRDPGETEDVSDEHPGVLVDLLRAHGTWRREKPFFLVR